MENKATDIDPSEDVAQWLKEVGQRKWPSPQPSSAECNAPPRMEGESASKGAPVVRRTLLLALLLVASLQYVYTNTTLEILSLPALLVFVFTG